MELKEVDIKDLIPYENNPRKNESAVSAVAENIKQCGYVAPIIVDENMVVLAGHTRLKAVKELGYTKLQVGIVRGLTEEQKKKYRILDNKTNEFAEWDFEALEKELEGLDFGDFDFGFDIDTEDIKLTSEDDEYTGGGIDMEPKTKTGDMYKLGDHVLMCGDSTDEECVKRLMGGQKADILFCSPPYNVGGGSFDNTPSQYWDDMENHGVYKGNSDNMSDEEYADFLCKIVDNGLLYCDDAMLNIGIESGSKFGIFDMIRRNIQYLCDVIVWNKATSFPLGMESQKAMLSHRCEFIYCFNHSGTRSFSHSQWKKGTAINRIDTMNASANEYSDIHKATFPVEFAFEVVKNFSKESVLDLFGGTGTTMIACEQLGRKCFMMEMNPQYCDVIIDRYEKYTGKKAVLIGKQ